MSRNPTLPPVPPGEDKDKWEKDFFEANGITDDKEKTVIRGRARVLAYDRARQAAEKKQSEPENAPEKKWYED